MRSTQVYRASDKVSNRFALCGTTARGVRIIHRHGDRIGDTISNSLEGVSGNGFRIQPRKATPAPRVDFGTKPGFFGPIGRRAAAVAVPPAATRTGG